MRGGAPWGHAGQQRSVPGTLPGPSPPAEGPEATASVCGQPQPRGLSASDTSASPPRGLPTAVEDAEREGPLLADVSPTERLHRSARRARGDRRAGRHPALGHWDTGPPPPLRNTGPSSAPARSCSGQPGDQWWTSCHPHGAGTTPGQPQRVWSHVTGLFGLHSRSCPPPRSLRRLKHVRALLPSSRQLHRVPVPATTRQSRRPRRSPGAACPGLAGPHGLLLRLRRPL